MSTSLAEAKEQYLSELGIELEAGARLANKDKYGDWYRDPWGWPECKPEFIASIGLHDVLEFKKDGSRFEYAGKPHFHVFDVPKSFLGTRPAVVQDPITRVGYAGAVAGLGVAIEQKLPDWSYGWRFRGGTYANGNDEWNLYMSSQESMSASSAGAQTDITSFFSSVEVDRFLLRLAYLFGDSPSMSVIREVLRAHDSLVSRSGLPQRSVASSILAQLATQPIDDELQAAIASGAVSKARRWMDDISFEGEEAALFGVLQRIQMRAREAGLEINASKTFLGSGGASAARLARDAQKLIDVPTVESILREEYIDEFTSVIDPSELQRLERQVLNSPRTTSRALANSILRSLRHHDLYDRAEDWMKVAHELPHAADGLSRFLASSRAEWWTDVDVDDWFPKFVGSAWSNLDWVAAQHSLVFNSDELPSTVIPIFSHWLSNTPSLQLLAVATQRLASAKPAVARSLINGRIDATADPLLIRLLAFGLIASGGELSAAVRALKRHPSNRLTLAYLEANEWRIPKVEDDFDHIERTPTSG